MTTTSTSEVAEQQGGTCVDLLCRVRRCECTQRHDALAACMEPAKPCERCHVEVAGALWAASPGLELVMIGWINLSVEAFIRDSFGDDAWAATVAKVSERPQRNTHSRTLRSRNCTQLRHAALARHECEQRLCTVRKWDRDPQLVGRSGRRGSLLPCTLHPGCSPRTRARAWCFAGPYPCVKGHVRLRAAFLGPTRH